MVKNVISVVSAALFFLSSCPQVSGQDLSLPPDDHRESFLLFDSIVGVMNTGIFRGVEYIEKHRMINENHKFLGPFDFQPGTIFYDEQPYFEIPMKYNIVEDLILVRLVNSNGKKILRLYDDKLQGFIIGDQEFLNITALDQLPIQGIHEVLLNTSPYQLLKKHLMKENKNMEKKLLYFEFEPDEPEFYLIKDREVIEVTRETLPQFFPKQKDHIRKYYRAHRRKLKNEPEDFMSVLIGDLISAAQ